MAGYSNDGRYFKFGGEPYSYQANWRGLPPPANGRAIGLGSVTVVDHRTSAATSASVPTSVTAPVTAPADQIVYSNAPPTGVSPAAPPGVTDLRTLTPVADTSISPIVLLGGVALLGFGAWYFLKKKKEPPAP